MVEVLAIHIRNDKTIEGIKIEGKETKISIFADDLTAFLRDKSSYENLNKTLEDFWKFSGLKINNDKTEAYWLGIDHKNPPAELTNVKSVNKPIKILGIFFCYDENVKESLNFDNVFCVIEKRLNMWKWRNLTILGKIQIIKSLIVPKISYRTNIVNLGPKRLKKLNSLLFNFIWNGVDKVKRITIFNNYEKGV